MLPTFANLKDHAELYGALSSAFSAGDVVNDAGRYLFTMHAWNFTLAPSVTLNFLADRSYVELPADFGTIVAHVMTSGLTSSVSFTNPENLARMRSESVSQSGAHYWATITYPRQSSRTVPPPPPRLEIWPTPSSASSGAMTLWYRRKWMDLIDDEDVPDMEPEFAPLLRMLVTAYAKSYDEEDTGSLDERLLVIEQGGLLKRLKEFDGMRQPDVGMLTGGAVQEYPQWNDFAWRATASSTGPS